MTAHIAMFRANLNLVIFNIVILIATSFGAVRTYALYENSLLLQPQWTATKLTLSRGVMGARAFVSSQQTLARNRLNLASWFGFQEVIYRDSLDLEKIEFRFYLEDDGYVHVLYDHRDSGFSGVRLSSRRDFPSSSYHATPDGEFTDIERLPLVSLTPNIWHRARITFTDDSATVTVNDEFVAVVSRTSGKQRIGFRGGQRNAWIDDVILTTRDGRIHRERFANTYRQWQRLGLFSSGLLVLTFVGFAALRNLSSIPPRHIGMGITMCLMVLACLVGATYVFQYVRGNEYPLLTANDARLEEL